MEQDELVHPAGAHEGVQDPVDGVLHVVLADHRGSALALLHARHLIERPIEELEAADVAGGPLHRLGAVVVEAVPDVLGSVARVHAGGFEERLHVLLEGEDRLVLEERAADLIADRL